MNKIRFFTVLIIFIHCLNINAVSVDQLKQDSRKLWTDHSVYTHGFIVSALADLQDLKVITDRLMKNQEDIGNSIVLFFGADAGKKLTELLKEHISLAGDIVKAAKANQQKTVKEKDVLWHKNAEDIAEFLSKANNNWSKADLLHMLNKHLELVSNILKSRLEKNWQADIVNSDENYDHILKLSDAIVDGLQKKFPEKFEKSSKIENELENKMKQNEYGIPQEFMEVEWMDFE